MGGRRGRGLTFDAAAGFAGDNVLLERDEKRQNGRDRQHRSGGNHPPIRIRSARQLRDAEGQGIHFGSIGDNQWPEKITPSANEDENRQGHQRGPHRGNHHIPPDAQFVAAIDSGRFFEFLRHALEGLAQQEDAKCRRDRRENHAEVGIHQAQVADQDEQRDHHNLEGDQNRGDHGGKDQVTAGEVHPGEGIGGEGAEQQIQADGETGHQDAIEEVAAKGMVFPDVEEVIEGELLGDKLGREGEEVFRWPLEGGADQPQHGGEHGDADRA